MCWEFFTASAQAPGTSEQGHQARLSSQAASFAISVSSHTHCCFGPWFFSACLRLPQEEFDPSPILSSTTIWFLPPRIIRREEEIKDKTRS